MAGGIKIHDQDELGKFDVLTVSLDDLLIANASALNFAICKIGVPITIKKVLLGVSTTVTAADTDYQTLSLTDGTNTIATIANGDTDDGTTIAAGAFGLWALDADYVDVAADATLEIDIAKTGNTGLAWVGAVVQIQYVINL